MKIHFLDVGDEQYGDCILVLHKGRSILIDGAHYGDLDGSTSAKSIPEQLRGLLGGGDQIKVSLLVVTHCHGDHIGCLPEMVADGILSADYALLAHDKAGYGLIGGQPWDAAVSGRDALLLALQEEPLDASAGDAEIAAFIADAGSQPKRYRQMADNLAENGTRVIMYKGAADDVAALEAEFTDFDLKILGPSEEHILRCAKAISGGTDQSNRFADSLDSRSVSLADAYRALAGIGSLRADIALFGADKPQASPAKNNQSIIIALGRGKKKALLTGDMQFAVPEIEGLEILMQELLAAVTGYGPYAFVKIPHHGSYNAFDRAVMKQFPATKSFAISTGRLGAAHPNPKTLRMLEEMTDQVKWARTDRNGRVSVSFKAGAARMDVSSGSLNDAVPKQFDTLPAPQAAEAPEIRAQAIAPAQAAIAAPQANEGTVEFTARIPANLAKVTFTVEIAQPFVPPLSAPPLIPPPAAMADLRLGGGRALPPLLFVTDAARLRAKIGDAGYAKCQSMIEAGGARFTGASDEAARAAEIARLAQGAGGIVILGDYSVIPARVYDVLPKELRQQISVGGEPDQFYVWSDQAHGDINGDGLGDLPVSRVPDCGRADFLLSQLASGHNSAAGRKFASRNAERPFAETVFSRSVPGTGRMLASAPATSRMALEHSTNSRAHYYMLHGDDSDATAFWGEDAGGPIEAVNIADVPDMKGATVFAGCCWGALIVAETASRAANHDAVTPRVPGNSLALRFLERGAAAFVGCTGAHYSPLEAPLDFFGEPMHRHFWQRLGAGSPPSRALFEAKQLYMREMPHGRTSSLEWAIEYKTLRQFTCLGLGW